MRRYSHDTDDVIYESLGKGGKNRRRGKNENENEKRELVFKDEDQGRRLFLLLMLEAHAVDTRIKRIRASRENAGQWST